MATPGCQVLKGYPSKIAIPDQIKFDKIKIELLFFWFVSEEYMVSFKYVRVNVNIYDLLELIKATPITVRIGRVQDHVNMIGKLSWIKGNLGDG